MPHCHIPAPYTVPVKLFTFLLAALLACPPASARAYAREAGPGEQHAPASADYPELAAALRQRLAGTSTPTPALTALAQRLAAGHVDPRMRALALSDWVRTHIRAADTPVRPGDAAPRPAAAVLDSGHGDSLEIAHLLQTLLNAAGIDASVALVSREPDEGLADPPTLAAFDTAIVHLPALGLYLAPYAHEVAAGYMPPALLGKPALLLASGRFAMTPMGQAQSVRSAATVDLRRDGSASLQLQRTYTGAAAEPARIAARAAVHDVPPAAHAQLAGYLLQDAGQVGQGAHASDSLDADGNYRMTLSSAVPQLLALPGAHSVPTDYAHLGTIAEALAALPRAGASGSNSSSGRAVCSAVDAEDQLRVRLPPELRIVDVPAALSVVQGGVFYHAAYDRQGNTVLIRRRLTFRSGRPVCSAPEARQMQPALARIERDLRSRIRVTQP
jgi:hypothetical protein